MALSFMKEIYTKLVYGIKWQETCQILIFLLNSFLYKNLKNFSGNLKSHGFYECHWSWRRPEAN